MVGRVVKRELKMMSEGYCLGLTQATIPVRAWGTEENMNLRIVPLRAGTWTVRHEPSVILIRS
jgi:hypothetical protein